MAIKQVMLDDLDGTELPEGRNGTVRFAFQGRSYEIDLSEANEEKLLEALRPFMAKAREVNDEESSLTLSDSLSGSGEGFEQAKANWRHEEALLRIERGEKPYELIDARRWLVEQGHKLSKVGPIPAELRALYEEEYGLPRWK